MSPEAWIIEELERERNRDVERPSPILDVDPRHERETPERCDEVRRGVSIIDVSPTPENQLDL